MLLTRSRLRFWLFPHSARLPSSGVSMPMKTCVKPASTIILISSSSSARLTLASVMNRQPFFPLRHSISAGRRSSFRARLLPIKLSSTTNTLRRQPRLYRASSSSMNCFELLMRILCPKSEVTLQKSQLNGQPRVYCRLIESYLVRSTKSQSGIGVTRISAYSLVS